MKYFIVLMLLAIAFIGGMWVNSYPVPHMERLHEDYVWLKIHEDWSYEGKRWNGIRETGCILEAICND